jgi:hypothetical protein
MVYILVPNSLFIPHFWHDFPVPLALVLKIKKMCLDSHTLILVDFKGLGIIVFNIFLDNANYRFLRRSQSHINIGLLLKEKMWLWLSIKEIFPLANILLNCIVAFNPEMSERNSASFFGPP